MVVDGLSLNMRKKLTILIPCFNSAGRIMPTLNCLVEAISGGLIKQVIFADGGSSDIIEDIADEVGADFVRTPKGRGLQFKIGVIYAKAEWLLFLHDDSILEDGWDAELNVFINDEANARKCAYFRHAFDDKTLAAKIVSFGVYLRCKIFALPYGDQGLLISRELYEEIGGFSSLPLMEDVEFIERIKAHIGRKNLIMLNSKLVTSANKYEAGYIKRILRNFKYLMVYKMGKDPKEIAKTYYK